MLKTEWKRHQKMSFLELVRAFEGRDCREETGCCLYEYWKLLIWCRDKCKQNGNRFYRESDLLNQINKLQRIRMDAYVRNDKKELEEIHKKIRDVWKLIDAIRLENVDLTKEKWHQELPKNFPLSWIAPGEYRYCAKCGLFLTYDKLCNKCQNAKKRDNSHEEIHQHLSNQRYDLALERYKSGTKPLFWINNENAKSS